MNAINCFNDQSLLLKRQLIPGLSGYDCMGKKDRKPN